MDVLMPQLGETVSEGTVATWHKKAGEPVEKGEILLDVDTDKVSTEIEAPVSGVIQRINVKEGETVDVGTVLAVIAVDNEEAVETAATIQESAVLKSRQSAHGLPEKSAGDRLSPAVRRLLKKHDLDIGDISGTGHDGRVTRSDVLRHLGLSDGDQEL